MQGTAPSNAGRVLLKALGVFAALLVLVALSYSGVFGPTDKFAGSEEFLVMPDESADTVALHLARAGYVRFPLVFQLAYLRESSGHRIRPGAYEISKSMDAWTIASRLVAPPYATWVKVPVGMRKEEIGDLLADALDWNDEERDAWTVATASTSPSYLEGVYFPDTYFIPTDEAPALIAERMKNRFKEAFAPYADEAVKKKVPWTRVLTIASLIQREAGSVSDMPIIAGIIEKRLEKGMPLALDATLQYMEGDEENRWWPKPKPAASYPDDPFNTYKRTGLPPHPIASPGLAAIEAALNPTRTDCLFYLHDSRGQMHCSPSYSGHVANINRYLR